MTYKLITEAVDKIKALPRYSFLSPKEGGVKRFLDKSGAWVEHYEIVKILDFVLESLPDVSGEPVGEMRCDATTGHTYSPFWYGNAPAIGDKLYTTPPPYLEALKEAKEALDKSDEAMMWELGGEPLPSLMIEARKLTQQALAKINELGE